MAIMESFIFYLLLGVSVAIANYAYGANGSSTASCCFRSIAAVFFWPLVLPVLLSAQAEAKKTAAEQATRVRDEMARAIQQVEDELDAALFGLDGWAEGTMARERDRILELRSAWRVQAERIREMDRLAEQLESGAAKESFAPGDIDRVRQSEQARRDNFTRLRNVRRQAFEDLMGTLAWVRELVSMIHLAKFTGAPASRADELVAQIAASVEGLSEVTAWKDESSATVASRLPEIAQTHRGMTDPARM